MYWTLELASYLEDAPWPATKEELIDFAMRTGAPLEVVENPKPMVKTVMPFAFMLLHSAMAWSREEVLEYCSLYSPSVISTAIFSASARSPGAFGVSCTAPGAQTCQQGLICHDDASDACAPGGGGVG